MGKGRQRPLKERLGVDLFRLQCGLAENHTPGEWLETRDAGRPLQQQKPFLGQRYNVVARLGSNCGEGNGLKPAARE
jgi:hypothetical protein